MSFLRQFVPLTRLSIPKLRNLPHDIPNKEDATSDQNNHDSDNKASYGNATTSIVTLQSFLFGVDTSTWIQVPNYEDID